MRVPVMPLYVDDLAGATSDLSPEEYGCYLRILCWTWTNGGRAPADENKRLARICGLSEQHFSAEVRPALTRFFEINGTWRQARLEKEWARVNDRLSQCQEAGRISAEVRKAKRLPAKPTDVSADVKTVVGTSIPTTMNHEPYPDPESEPNPHPEPTKPKRRSKSKQLGLAAVAEQVGADLPTWLPVTLWNAWRGHRRALKKPMTEHAEELSLKTITDLRAKGHDPVKIIETSIERGWLGFFSPEQGPNGKARSVINNPPSDDYSVPPREEWCK